MATINGTQYDDKIYSPTTPGTSAYFRNGKKAGNLNDSTNGDDSISTGNGNDLIYAGGGVDTIAGGNGNDTIYGEAGADIIWGDSFSNSDGNDNGQDKLYGGAGNDQIHGGNGKDEIDGGTDNDTLYGDNGSDIIQGGAGDDIINGGNGGDVLNGDVGVDTFVYTTNTSSAVSDSPYLTGAIGDPTLPWTKPWDVIRDFETAVDKIDLSGLPLTGGGPSPLVWRGPYGTDASAGQNDTDRADGASLAHSVWTAEGFLYADINGDGKADLKVQVSGVAFGDLIGAQENDAPTFDSGTSGSEAENTATSNVVYDANATDPEDDTLTYSLTGTDASLFDIDATTGEVTFKDSPNFEDADDNGTDNVYNFTVVASDGFVSTDQAVAITVTDVNEAPVAPANFSESAAENVDTTTVLATVVGTDPDTGGGNDATSDFENLTYSITGGNGGGLFEIDAANGEISLATGQSLDFETAQSHVLTVAVTDGPSLSSAVDVTINVTDVNEQPNAGADFTVSAAENVADTVVLADVNATDPDTGGGNDGANDYENLTYSITAGNGASLFEIDAATGEISLITGQSLNYEDDNQHVLTVRATDGPGLFDETQVTINVTDVVGNAAPVANNDVWVISDDVGFIIPLSWLLHNDTDANPGDALTVTSVTEDTDAGAGVTVGDLSWLTPNFSAGNLTSITITDPDVTSGTFTLSYTLSDGTDTDIGTITLTVLATGNGTQTIVLDGNDFSYIDGQNAVDTLDGDLVLAGNAGIDTFFGGAGDDVMTGGAGADVMTGNGGADTFVIGDTDSGITLATADRITDFATTADKLKLGLVGDATADTGNYVEAGSVVTNFAAALTAANAALATLGGTSGAAELYAFQFDATNGYLFNDIDGDGDADQVIVLTGITNAGIAATDIIA